MNEFVRRLNDTLTQYQKDFVRDQSERIIVLKSRRIGFSEAACVKGLLKAISIPHHDVHLVSRSYREAKELIRTATRWVDMMAEAGLCHAHTTKTYIELDNDSRLLALPSKAVRSRGGTVVLDETADVDDARAVYDAVAPAVESDPAGQLILISTPMGREGLFYDVWTNEGGEYEDFSRHKVDVYDAVKNGCHWLPDTDDMADRYPRDVWAQEFCCEFVGQDDQYFDWPLIRKATKDPNPEVWAEIAASVSREENERLVAGLDVGASNDRTVLATVKAREERRHIERLDVIKPAGERRDLRDQYRDVRRIVDSKEYDRLVVDGAGLGKQMAEDLARAYSGDVSVTKFDEGDWRDKPGDLIPEIRGEMERGELTLCDNRDLQIAFSKIVREVAKGGQISFSAPRDGSGHADPFYAALLALYDEGFAFLMG